MSSFSMVLDQTFMFAAKFALDPTDGPWRIPATFVEICLNQRGITYFCKSNTSCWLQKSLLGGDHEHKLNVPLYTPFWKQIATRVASCFSALPTYSKHPRVPLTQQIHAAHPHPDARSTPRPPVHQAAWSARPRGALRGAAEDRAFGAASAGAGAVGGGADEGPGSPRVGRAWWVTRNPPGWRFT